MADALPYLSSPGSIQRCLEKISNAATPEKVTGDFINTKLAIKGGGGRALVPFLKKIGFVNSDGTPSKIYIKFRNPSEAEIAVSEAIKIGYKPLYESNEYAHDLGDVKLKGLIVQVTGLEASSNVVKLTYNTFKKLREVADFESQPVIENETEPESDSIITNTPTPSSTPQIQVRKQTEELGMNLSYTINLNLPATSDISVFNAIFKSLKENLLKSDES